MKKLSIYLLTGLFTATALMYTGCNKKDDDNGNGNVLPGTFMVNIPDAISNPETSSKKSVTSKGDTVSGDELYEHLTTFIYLGEESAKIVDAIINAISQYEINKAMSFNYTSDEDGREKECVVIENASYEGVDYEFQMTISDIQSKSNADGGKALQVFWNTSPIKGVAIIKPYNSNRNENILLQNAMYRVDYSEAGENGYEKQMVIYITGLPTVSQDVWAIDKMKMFAGKKGDIIEVFGNSNHPNGMLFTQDKGYTWAFSAAGDQVENIGVAEVGLPQNTVDATDRVTILETNSMRNVLTDKISEWYLAEYGTPIDSAALAGYLAYSEAPGYFDSEHFVAAGTAPNSDYDVIESAMDALTPYNPNNINNLTIEFK